MAEIRLPKKLKSLKLTIYQPELYISPLLNCTTVDTLFFRDLPATVLNLADHAKILQFPTIKTLNCFLEYNSYAHYLQRAPLLFLNVESFKIIVKLGRSTESELEKVPNFPKLRYLESIWSMNSKGEK